MTTKALRSKAALGGAVLAVFAAVLVPTSASAVAPYEPPRQTENDDPNSGDGNYPPPPRDSNDPPGDDHSNVPGPTSGPAPDPVPTHSPVTPTVGIDTDTIVASGSCSWTVKGRLVVRNPTMDGLRDNDGVVGAQVKVSGRQSFSPLGWNTWETVVTDVNGDFTVRHTDCQNQKLKVEAKFESDDLWVTSSRRASSTCAGNRSAASRACSRPGRRAPTRRPGSSSRS